MSSVRSIMPEFRRDSRIQSNVSFMQKFIHRTTTFSRIAISSALRFILGILHHVFCDVRPAEYLCFLAFGLCACICHQEIRTIRGRMKKRFHGVTIQSISLSFSLPCPFSFSLLLSLPSALESSRTLPLAPTLLRLFPLHPWQRAFDPQLLLCHVKRLSKCFVIPEKMYPVRKLILHPDARSVTF